jgi:hypothetical protein
MRNNPLSLLTQEDDLVLGKEGFNFKDDEWRL